MAIFHLQQLEPLDQAIGLEHKAWLEEHLSKLFIVSSDFFARFDAGLLNFPELWSGSRVGETTIAKQNAQIASCYSEIQEQIARAKQQHETDAAFLAQLQAFDELYQAFFNRLKERFLAQAIETTLSQISNNEHLRTLIDFYHSPDRSPVNFQTQDQCVAEHDKITKIIKAHRAKPALQTELRNLTQLEILSKRKLDMHYESVTKKTKAELVLNKVSLASSVVGLLTGVAAIGCWIGAFFFPPLILPAAILSYVSYASYGATAISVGKVIKNAVNGRPPSKKEVKELVIEAVLLPLNVIGRGFTALRHLFKSATAIKAIRDVGNITNNVISNGMDVPFVPQIKSDAKEVMQDIDVNNLTHSTSVTTRGKVASALLEKHAVAEVEKTTVKLATSIKTHGIVFAKETNTDEILATSQSRHLFIAGWDAGFFASKKYGAEIKHIQTSVADYAKLPANACYKDRYLALTEIQCECINYLSVAKNTTPGFLKVSALKEAVVEECNALVKFIEGEEQPEYVPEATQQFRPMLVAC